MLLPGDGACVRAAAKSYPVGILALPFWHLCIFPPRAGLCSACFAKLYVAAIKPPVGELTYLVELSGGLPTTTSRQGEKTSPAVVRLRSDLGKRYVMTAGMRFQYQTIAV